MPGPGEYVPDPTEGVTRVEDLPKPIVRQRSRGRRKAKCPKCGYQAFRNKRHTRRLHDLGDPESGRPRDIELEVSQHLCTQCETFFYADTSDLAPRGSHYTHRVKAADKAAVDALVAICCYCRVCTMTHR